MIFIFEFIFAVIIFGIADYHAFWFHKNGKVGFMFHTLWSLVYFVPAFLISHFLYESWWMMLYLALERFVLYNPILNKIRNMPFFYLSISSGKNSSLFDWLELKWNKWYHYVWYGCALLFAVGQFFITRLVLK